MELGLLTEAVRAQQQIGEDCLRRLEEHTRGLDAVVRDEIHRTIAEELESLSAESRGASEALGRLRRAAHLRLALFTVGVTAFASALALFEAWWLLPSRQEIASLRARRDQLETRIEQLEQAGGGLELGRCGVRRRLCVRVDGHSRAYGARADYRIVAGG